MRIEYFVKHNYLIATPYSGINEIKSELLKQKAVVVKENETYIGTLTGTDILQKPHNLAIDCITERKHLSVNSTVKNALKMMKAEQVDVLSVYRNKQFVGLVYKNDLIEYLTEYTNELEQKISVRTKELKYLNNNLEDIVLQRTKELRELNTTKDKFFSIIAHDLISPFNSIIGLSELLKENTKEMSIDKIHTFADSIYNTSCSTFKLLENLLIWGKLQQEKVLINKEKFNLHCLISEIVFHTKNIAKQKNISITHNIHEKTYIYADNNMIRVILLNLISNSIKYTNKNGKVSVSSKFNENYIEMLVKDNGIGISQKDQKRLFKIDEDYSTKGTDNEQGTGLGLILCKEFVEKHGGKIHVKSELNKGSEFYFTILTLKNNLSEK